MPRTVFTVCPHDCPSACALTVTLDDDGRILRVYGNHDQKYTAGVVCAKVARYTERLYHPERLMRPMRRVGAKGEGRFEPISWPEALDEVADVLKERARSLGADTVWPYNYGGTMGLVQRGALHRLRHVMGYSRMTETICSRASGKGWLAGTGAKWGTDPREIAAAEIIVLWGTNPVVTQVNLMTHIARARKTHKVKLIVVDPYRTPTAEQADLHLMLRPGTDGALACAVMQVLFQENLADRAYLDRYTDQPQALAQHLTARTPEWAAAITGLEAEEIRRFARLYGSTRHSYIRLGYGFTRQRNGAFNMHAVSCLPAVTGAWQVEGGGAMYSMSDVFKTDMTALEGTDRLDTGIRSLDMSRMGPVLAGNRRDLGDGPPVTAMIVQNANPADAAPATRQIRTGLAREDLFLCVHEQFMTATAKFADILLPATQFLEHDDVYTAGGHSFLQLGPQAVPPPGETRSNQEVVAALARRLGSDHPGDHMTAWELIDDMLLRSGYGSVDALAETRWIDCLPDFRTTHFLSGFAWPDERFRFAPDWGRQDGTESTFALSEAPSPGNGSTPPPPPPLPTFPDHVPILDEPDETHPFRLVTAPARHFLNTSFTETPSSRRRERRPTLKLHPLDARALEVRTGESVQVGKDEDAVTLVAEVIEGIQRGVVVVESIWPGDAFPEGVGINTLISPDPGQPASGAVFHDTAVWIRPARAAEGRPTP